MSEEHRKLYFPPPTRRLYAYPFYQTKDKDDCLKKTLVLGSYTGLAGTGFAFAGALRATVHESPVFGSHLLIRLAKYSVPAAAAGAMFPAAICTISNLRGGANDPWNHFFGGLATGSVIGLARKNHSTGWACGILIGIAAFIWKAGKLEGWADGLNAGGINRSKGFYVYRRSWFTDRPDPEGDQSLS